MHSQLLNFSAIIIFFVILLHKVTAEKLECHVCSEINPDLLCSKNETATRKAEDDAEYSCRIWALNGVPVNKGKQLGVFAILQKIKIQRIFCYFTSVR